MDGEINAAECEAFCEVRIGQDGRSSPGMGGMGGSRPSAIAGIQSIPLRAGARRATDGLPSVASLTDLSNGACKGAAHVLNEGLQAYEANARWRTRRTLKPTLTDVPVVVKVATNASTRV